MTVFACTGVDPSASDVDGMPYTSLLYGTGPGYGRENLTEKDTQNPNYIQQSAVPRRWSTHTGEDVPVYAQGPMSHLFRGALDQTYIPHAIAYAMCIGDGLGQPRCQHQGRVQATIHPKNASAIRCFLPPTLFLAHLVARMAL